MYKQKERKKPEVPEFLHTKYNRLVHLDTNHSYAFRGKGQGIHL